MVGINLLGHSAGFYIDAGRTNHGFLDIKGTFQTVDFPGTSFNQLLGVNEFDQAAGYYADTNGYDHATFTIQKAACFSC